MKGRTKKIFAITLSALMVLSLIPQSVFAQDLDIDGALDINLDGIDKIEIKDEDFSKKVVSAQSSKYPNEYTTSSQDGSFTFKVGEDEFGEYAIITGRTSSNTNKEVTIPSVVSSSEISALGNISVAEIGDGTGALKNFSNVEKITFATGFTEASKINNSAFSGLTNLRYFEIPQTSISKFTEIGGFSGSGAASNIFDGCDYDKLTIHGAVISDASLLKKYIKAISIGNGETLYTKCSVAYNAKSITVEGDGERLKGGVYTVPLDKSIKVLSGDANVVGVTDYIKPFIESEMLGTQASRQKAKVEITGSGYTYDENRGVITPNMTNTNSTTATLKMITTDGTNISSASITRKTDTSSVSTLPSYLSGFAVSQGSNYGKVKLNSVPLDGEVIIPSIFRLANGNNYITARVEGLNLDGVKKVYLPDSLSNYGAAGQTSPFDASGFSGCSTLEYINIPSTLTTSVFGNASQNVFSGVGTKSTLYIHYDSTKAGEQDKATEIWNWIANAGGKAQPIGQPVDSISGPDSIFLTAGKYITKAAVLKGFSANLLTGTTGASMKTLTYEVNPEDVQYAQNGVTETSGVFTAYANGNLKGNKVGSGTIYVMSTDGTRTKKPVKVYVSSVTGKLTPWKTQATTLKASFSKLAYPANVADTKVIWKSSNTKIATVTSLGKVVTKNSGNVTITASLVDTTKKNQVLATANTLVKVQKPVLVLKTKKLKIKKGKSAKIKIKTQKPTKKQVKYKITYKVANKKSKKIVSVSKTGKVKAKKKGKAKIYVYGFGKVRATCTVTVK